MAPGIYYGVNVPSRDLTQVTAFEGDAQKAVAIVMWYQQWGMTDGSQFLQSEWMSEVRTHGSIPLITWEPWNPFQGVTQPAYALQQIIDGMYDAYILNWAQASIAWGHPYFLRFAHEMNGNWYPWSEQTNGNTAGQFVLAWQHVHNLFTSQGVSNVTWVWCPNVAYPGSTSLQELYPGDATVDWIGMDGYNWGSIQGHVWQPFSSVFQQTYQELLSITARPMMIAETASAEQSGNKASWISDAFSTQLPHDFPSVRAFTWFNENKETDWRIESSPAAQNAFATAIQSTLYASDQYASLATTPIPPPALTVQTSVNERKKW